MGLAIPLGSELYFGDGRATEDKERGVLALGGANRLNLINLLILTLFLLFPAIFQDAMILGSIYALLFI